MPTAGVHFLPGAIPDLLWVGCLCGQIWAQVCAPHVDPVRMHLSHHLWHGGQLRDSCHRAPFWWHLQRNWRVCTKDYLLSIPTAPLGKMLCLLNVCMELNLPSLQSSLGMYACKGPTNASVEWQGLRSECCAGLSKPCWQTPVTTGRYHVHWAILDWHGAWCAD
jgi:hypothetical protein